MNKIIVNNLYKASNLALLTLPILSGCGGGSGGGSSSVGALFSPESSPGTGTTVLTSATDAGVNSGIATIHNPEPATMLLLGGGMLVMGLIKSQKRASKYS
jgi:hypothetical protein